VILVDTSAWIEFFRGRSPFATRVDEILDNDQAAVCGPIITEIRRGLRSRRDRDQVIPLLEGCHLLVQPDALWAEAGDIGWWLGRRGATVRSFDLLIAAYALAHEVPILAADRDFAMMARAGLGLLLAEP
jgi:predicted nucleic acid-binding protein